MVNQTDVATRISATTQGRAAGLKATYCITTSDALASYKTVLPKKVTGEKKVYGKNWKLADMTSPPLNSALKRKRGVRAPLR
jgi:hypothetical protein